MNDIKNLSQIAIILGNGSSLKGFNFPKILDGITTFGTCAAYRYWYKIQWFPTHYVNMDHVVLKSHMDAIKSMVEEKRCDTFLIRKSVLNVWPDAKLHKSIVFLEDIQRTSVAFSKMRYICTGSASTLYAIHLGYKDVRLLGMDCDYVEFIPECKLLKDGTLCITSTPKHNPNYFIDDYQRSGDIYNKPNGTRVHMSAWVQTSRSLSESLFGGDQYITNYNTKNTLSKIFHTINDISQVCDTTLIKTHGIIKQVDEPFINMITQYCNINNKQRQYEYDTCVLNNLNNRYTKHVYLLNEHKTKVPDYINNHDKCTVIYISGWLTYKQAFHFASKTLPNEICCLSNLDIFLDHGSNWNTIIPIIKNAKIIFCQSRYEYDGKKTGTKDPVLQRFGYCNSQDAWIFKANNLDTIQNCDFKIGLSGCDNAIADRMHKAGFILVNSPNVYKIMHFDVCRNKNETNTMDFHRREDIEKSKNSHPEQHGYRLLPDIDMFGSLESVCKTDLFKLSTIEQYMIACDIFTKKLFINNT